MGYRFFLNRVSSFVLVSFSSRRFTCVRVWEGYLILEEWNIQSKLHGVCVHGVCVCKLTLPSLRIT